MSLGLYDKVIVEKLRQWTSASQPYIFGPDDTKNMIQILADDNRDNSIKLPIITIQRIGGFTIKNTNKIPLSYDGMMTHTTDDRSSSLNAIPIQINYVINVYCRYREEVDEYVRNIVFNTVNHPTVVIEIPYEGMDYVHNATIRVDSEIDDTSDVPERLINGQFYRMSLNVNIDDAYLWDIKIRKNITVDGVNVVYNTNNGLE